MIDEEISRIRSTKVGSEELLTETELDKIDELELKKNKLFQDAIKDNEEYQQKMARYRELKTFDENWGLYNKIRAEKIAEYGANSEEFKLWEKLNKFRRPSEKYYREIERIYDRINSILGESDPEMNALMQERAKIRRKYKMNGTFYSGNMDPQDIKAYDAVETKINELRKAATSESEDEKLPLEVRKKLGVQYERLSKLRVQKQTESYTTELNLFH